MKGVALKNISDLNVETWQSSELTGVEKILNEQFASEFYNHFAGMGK